MGETLEELRDAVANALEENGVLARFKAQLRKEVFVALNETSGARNPSSSTLKQLFATDADVVALSLVKDFLEAFDLDYTVFVLNAEAALKGRRLVGTEKLRERLDLQKQQPNVRRPLLTQLLARVVRPVDEKEEVPVSPVAAAVVERPAADSPLVDTFSEADTEPDTRDIVFMNIEPMQASPRDKKLPTLAARPKEAEVLPPARSRRGGLAPLPRELLVHDEPPAREEPLLEDLREEEEEVAVKKEEEEVHDELPEEVVVESAVQEPESPTSKLLEFGEFPTSERTSLGALPALDAPPPKEAKEPKERKKRRRKQGERKKKGKRVRKKKKEVEREEEAEKKVVEVEKEKGLEPRTRPEPTPMPQLYPPPKEEEAPKEDEADVVEREIEVGLLDGTDPMDELEVFVEEEVAIEEEVPMEEEIEFQAPVQLTSDGDVDLAAFEVPLAQSEEDYGEDFEAVVDPFREDPSVDERERRKYDYHEDIAAGLDHELAMVETSLMEPSVPSFSADSSVDEGETWDYDAIIAS